MGLATTLAITAAVVLLAFVCLAACFGHLTLSTREQRLGEAESAADSVAQLATARLLADPTFGTHGTAAERSLEVALPQGTARLTFDPDTALAWGIPLSRNHLLQEEAMPGYLRTIPAQSVQLLAQGQSGGRVRLVEVVLNQPPFKWAVASTGNLHSTGGLKVFGVKDLAHLANGINNVPPEQVLPGHIVSDATAADALLLDSSSAAPTLITGDAQAMGGVQLGPSTTVNGRVKEQSESARLPEIVVENYDPAGVTGLQEVSQSNLASNLAVSGVWRRSGNLVISQGGLTLDEGYFYVDGNLEVFGGLSGKGAIFATGNVTVHGLSSFASDNLQAIIARGDLRLEGSGPENSSFQGLLMGGGENLSAQRVSLVGSFLGTRPGGGSRVDLDQVQLVSNPQAIHLDLPSLMTPPQNPVPYDGFQLQQVGPTSPSRTRGTPIGGGDPRMGPNITAVIDPNLDVMQFYDPVRDVLDPAMVTADTFKVHYRFSDGYLAKSYELMRAHANMSDESELVFNSWAPGPQLIEDFKEGVSKANQVYQENRRHGLPAGQLSLDPNSFIQTSDKMRRVLWRVIP